MLNFLKSLAVRFGLLKVEPAPINEVDSLAKKAREACEISKREEKETLKAKPTKSVEEFIELMPTIDVKKEIDSLGFFKALYPDTKKRIKKGDGKLLTVDQKKKFELNVRKKYGWDFINLIKDEHINRADEIDESISNLYSSSDYMKKRKASIKQLLASSEELICVSTSKDSCSCAKKLEGQNFKLAELPILPLANCDKPVCKCKYDIPSNAQ
ncbi:hypothetical protein [Francisella frigiditurris]|uniref:Uncharacterized protein n=1 Tax=Francisella frigiditurris TaxID=1542390 RepID=A0A1J0KTK7_9GAMM|nr:hypothetical protein [Francisella frigiditurris]APC97034.1 hypothetical protein KX01_421 [Francisella frigiditurris]